MSASDERGETPDDRSVHRRTARAGETHEFWPELQFHKWLNERQSCAIFMMSHSRDRDSDSTDRADVGLTFEHHFSDWFWGRLGHCHGNPTERIQVQRDVTIGNYLFTTYASAEVCFDTQYDQMSRYRLILGVTLPICEHFSVEPYLVRQVDNACSFTITNAIGPTLVTSF